MPAHNVINSLPGRITNIIHGGRAAVAKAFFDRRQDVNARAFPTTKSRVRLADENVSFFNGRVKGAFVLSKRM